MKESKKYMLVLVILSLFLIINKNVLALGLLSEGGKRLSYEPYLERTYQFLVQHTTKDVKIIVSGYPMEYVTLTRDFIAANDPDKSFYVTIKFPETTLIPGHHQIKIEANEAVDEIQGMGTSVDVATHIKIDVLYPGKYAEVKFTDASILNHTAKFSIFANNFGKQTINSFRAKIDIYDSEDGKLDTVWTDEKSIASDKSEIVRATLDVENYEVGDYKATATVFWDDNQTIVERAFRVGAMHINIADYTKKFTAGSINKFEVKLANIWNDMIKDVYVIAKINNEQLRSPTADIDAFSTKVFDLYWDITNIKPGNYPIEIRAYYLSKTTIEIGQVTVVDKEPPKVKLAPLKRFPIYTVALISIILLIIIIDLIWLLTRKDKADKNEKNK